MSITLRSHPNHDPNPPTHLSLPSDACRTDFYLAASANGEYDEQYVDKCEADGTGNNTACCTCPTGADCAEGSTIETIAVFPHYYRHSLQSAQVLECPQKFACPGDSNDDEGDDDGQGEEEDDEYNPCAKGRPNPTSKP